VHATDDNITDKLTTLYHAETRSQAVAGIADHTSLTGSQHLRWSCDVIGRMTIW